MRAPEIERYAAAQLCDYDPTRLLSAAGCGVLLLAGKTTAASGDQAIVLRRTTVNGRPVLIAGGGSPRATLWAVAEFVERYWGVRYLLHRGILPPRRTFSLPVADEHRAPVYSILAKIKFNRLFLSSLTAAPPVGGLDRTRHASLLRYHLLRLSFP